MLYSTFSGFTRENPPEEYGVYASVNKLEIMWHEEARPALLQGGQPVEEVPSYWTAAEAVSFMKDSAALKPLAIVAFVGDQTVAGEGFMVMQIPEEITNVKYAAGLDSWYTVVMLTLFTLFVVSSWFFFIMIRRRLLRLQTAMAFTGREGLPSPVPPGKPDEIGRLEEAFNTMITELGASRAREAEEEGLRKRLVSELSHDLRTPLTVIRSHLHVLGKEELSLRGKESLELMDQRIEGLGILIENLLSYNLLSSGRMALNLERRDVLRLLRESAAAWYPVWEKEGFRIEIDLEAAPLYWDVDDSWFRRVLDNLFQNILRHARSGLYAGIVTEIRNGDRVIVISDHGGGMNNGSTASKGAGLGLSIVALLLKRMELEWSVESNVQGTEIVIWKRLPAVKKLNLNIGKGEIYGFLGPNGAGKTTTIRMLLGLIKPTSGSIDIFGRELQRNKLQILRKVGSLVESPSYYGHLNALDNLEAIRRILDVPKPRIAEVLDIVSLTGEEKRPVKGFSLGMKQRLGIAAALLGSPELLILDEPTNGLDPSGIQEIRSLIKRLPEEQGITVLVSSHLLSEIEQMAGTVGIIREGQMVYQDTIAHLQQQAAGDLRLALSEPEAALGLAL
ncbi:hypothetical protein KC345_g8999, partial [Hortaea werneckii]